MVLELNKKNLRNIFLGVAGCIVLYFVLHETGRIIGLLKAGIKILMPFIVGAVMAFILNVPMRAIEKWLSVIKKPGIRRALAILLTMIAVALVLTGVFGAHMEVTLTNDGPVTIVMDSDVLKKKK